MTDNDPLADALGERPLSAAEEVALARAQHAISEHEFATRWRPRFALELLTAGVLAAVVVTVIVALGHAATPAPSHPRPSPSPSPLLLPGVVPWVDTAAGPAPPPSPTPAPSAPPAGIPTCRSSDLHAHAGFRGSAAQTYAVELVFTDHGRSACVLRGNPLKVRLLDARGRVVTEYPVAFGGSDVPVYSNTGVELHPGVPDGGADDQAIPGQAFLVFQTEINTCGRASVASIVVTLSDGGEFRFNIGFAPDPYGDCVSPQQYPPMMSSFQLPSYPPPAAVTPPPDLEVAITVTGPAHLGATFTYTVTLTNVSGHAIAFTACPGYSESIKTVASARYLLNCAGAPTLAVGASRTFAMELPVSAGGVVTPGQYPLDWALDGPLVTQQIGDGPVDVAVSG